MNQVVKHKPELTPIRRHLLVIGKTQTEIARDARMTKAAVSAYVNRLRTPQPRRIRDLAFALQVSPERLVDLIAAS